MHGEAYGGRVMVADLDEGGRVDRYDCVGVDAGWREHGQGQCQGEMIGVGMVRSSWISLEVEEMLWFMREKEGDDEEGRVLAPAWWSMKKGGGIASGCLSTSGVGDGVDGCALMKINREGRDHEDGGRDDCRPRWYSALDRGHGERVVCIGKGSHAWGVVMEMQGEFGMIKMAKIR